MTIRRDRLINRFYKRTPHYKWSVLSRIIFFFVAITIWLPSPVFFESGEQVIENLTYETVQGSTVKNSVITRTKYYTILHGSSGSSYSVQAHSYSSGIKVGDRFKVGRNLLMKSTRIWFVDRGKTYEVTDGGSAQFIFSAISIAGFFSLFKKPSYREIKYLNVFLIANAGMLLFYFLS